MDVGLADTLCCGLSDDQAGNTLNAHVAADFPSERFCWCHSARKPVEKL